MLELWPVIVLGAVVAYTMLRYRETFIIKYGDTSAGEPLLSYEDDAPGTRLFSIWDSDTCPPGEPNRDKTEYEAGLCYTPCKPQYNGVGPVCWAETEDIGVGKPVGLEPCPQGWVNDGLICRQPITCATGWKFFTEGCSGGRLRGRLDGGGICDWPDKGVLPNWLLEKRGGNPKDWIATHPDKIAGLCYRKCPKDKPNHVPGMPYLCYEGKHGLSYGRGAGVIPPMFGFGPKRD
jgi:hypothetical protein